MMFNIHDQQKHSTSPANNLALLSLALSILLASLGTSIANIALPTLAEALVTSFQAVQWVVLVYLLVITSLIISLGRLGDLFGRRRLLLAGIALFTLGALLCGLATNLALLLAARVVQGLGAAAMMALTMAFVADTVEKEKIGRAMGMLGSMSAIGTALGPTLGGLLLAHFAWPAIFFAFLPISALTLLLAWRYLPAVPLTKQAKSAQFDLLGAGLLAVSLAAYALAMTSGHGKFTPFNLSLLLGAAGGLGIFVLVESKTASPLMQLAILRRPEISAGCAMSALATTVVMASLVIGPFYLTGALALKPTQVGLAMSCGPIVAALAGVPSGYLTDRFGAAKMCILGLLGMFLGCVAMFSLAQMTNQFGQLSVLSYVVPLTMLTAAYALFQAANNSAVMASSPAQLRGLISAMLNLARNLGLITGASAMGAAFAYGAASSDILHAQAAALTSGLQLSYVIAAVLLLFAVVIGFIGRAYTGRNGAAECAH